MHSRRDQVLYVWFLIATWVALLVTFFFNGIGTIGQNLGIFINNMQSNTDTFSLGITPASWTFSIWGFIYAYQLIWIIYATANLFRRGNDGTRLYAIAPFLHWSLFIAYILNLVCNVAWLFLWDRQYIIPALVALVLAEITIAYCSYISIVGIYKHYPILCAQGFRIENRLVLGIVTNGIGMYDTWLLIATHLNLGIVLVYSAGLSQATGSAIAIALLTFFIAVWWVLDLGVLEHYTRFLYTPYIVFSVAFIGILVKNFDAENPTMIFITMLLIATIAMLTLKILIGVRNHKKDSGFPKCEEKMETETVIVYN